MARKVTEQLWRMTNKPRSLGKALDRAADRTIARATRLSRASGGKATYSKREGIRPGGRRYVDIVSDSPEEERGTEDTPRTNALRRAARGET